VAAIDMVMLDAVHEQVPRTASNRCDALGGSLLILSYTYGVVGDQLPDSVRSAYEMGLRKFVVRLEEWGPRQLDDGHGFVRAGGTGVPGSFVERPECHACG
jgi:hypothetical protein